MPLEFSDGLLSAYLDGELSPAERTQVESQLAADPQARQLLDELRALSGEVRELPRYSAGSGFSQRVVQAALAAKAEQNGAVPQARQVSLPSSQQSSDKSHPDKARRGARLPVVLAGVAAVAAAVAIMVWAYNRPGHLPVPGPGPGTIAVEPVVPVPAAISQAAEEALARLRLAIPQEGEAVVLRIRLGAGQSPAAALDAAFAAAGLATRQADDDTTGAYSIATAYQNKLAEKIAGQSDATLAAADAVFVKCPLDMLEKAVASLGSQPKSSFELAPLMSGRVLEIEPIGEEAPTGPPKPKHFAQRLAAEQFRLEKSGSALAEIAPLAAATLDATKPIRVLILVEQ